MSSKSFVGNTITEIFENDRVLAAAIGYARANNCSYTEHDFKLGVPGHARLHLSCTVTPVELEAGSPAGRACCSSSATSSSS